MFLASKLQYKRAFNCLQYSTINAIMDKCKIAVCQLTSTNNKTENFEAVERLISKAKEENVNFVFLPEAVDYIGENKDETAALAETLEGNLVTKYKALAIKYNVWMSIGGLHEKPNEISESATVPKLYNTHIVINNEGKIEATYRKLHLFDVSIPEKNLDLKESDNILRGNKIMHPTTTPIGPLGLCICYDLRFPEVSTILRKMGAAALTYPSAFTHLTGEAHWEVLLRARAVENQCYVIAAAQFGAHNSKRTSHGHAMIIDPWGKIIAECPKYEDGGPKSNECLAAATIDVEILNKIRTEMPLLEHRRNDIYSLYNSNLNMCKEPENNYLFGTKEIPSTTIFFCTKYSYAFTNIRCVVPGHVLVSSIRAAKRLNELLPEEISDLFQTVVRVQKAVEERYNATSSTICVQDGQEAGQTITHVHCHILPRKRGDFEKNDDIYDQLAKHDKENSEAAIRSLHEMSIEAQELKEYFAL